MRLVVKDYKQKPEIDYLEVFAPIDKVDTVHMIMNGIFNEEVYVEQSAGFVRRD